MKFNRRFAIYLLSGFLFTFSYNKVTAQENARDSFFYQSALANTMAVYHQSFGSQSALYNGSRYGEYPYRFNEGQPYFNAREPVMGSVIYDGIRYDSVRMRYDEVADALVINGQANFIMLANEKVAYFRLYDSDFIRLATDSSEDASVSSGFYNLLYKGKTILLKKQIKRIREVIVNLELQRLVDTKDYYYLKKDETIYPVKSRNDLYKLLKDHKKEVQQFLKTNDLNFRVDRQNMLIKTMAYYDSLK